MSGDVAAHGARPLVIVADTTIVIDHALDVASHIGGNIGPGAQPAAICQQISQIESASDIKRTAQEPLTLGGL